MYRYKDRGHVIDVYLPKSSYYVECRYFYSKDDEKYSLDMWLRKDDFDDKFKIDGQNIDIQLISGDRLTIRTNICRVVEYAYQSGFFKKYMERFEYTYKCFDAGYEVLEQAQGDK